ncbi:BrnT family toxin [Amphiplicatus metriothermophilus]|uniref:Uncharacterized protein n=1 Tax=Amphiplicatus metriothermophilus TaxID=1519374 RepID=A0A239PZH2_9PROT|nr:BrnT family toxin [Amphiplicatus metriothermophilus]MBB5518315.1 hypothetical protein [Amphiplicatus metriothermophilus]SNT75570.1 hypothetical protein SAMN06297382_2821 [Amphiplicatus metriothermophilus]
MARRFEWDENKRQEVLKKRKIDLLEAARMFNTPEKMEVWVDQRQEETRVNAIGEVAGVWYELVYAERGDVIRLITAWKLNEKTKRKAQARYARRARRDEGARRDT